MLILAIDASHKNGSVCLARGDAERCDVIGTAEVDGGMFSAQLVPAIAQLLKHHSLDKKDLQGIAAAVGPGSFTGLRIGLAAVKGLAEVLRIPIAGVSTLEAVAVSAQNCEPANVLAVLDAGRGEFYVGEYSDGNFVSENLLTREEFARVLGKSKIDLVVSPESAVVDMASSQDVRFESVVYPGAETIAKLGLRKFASRKTTKVDELDANYVRRDAGLFSSSK